MRRWNYRLRSFPYEQKNGGTGKTGQVAVSAGRGVNHGEGDAPSILRNALNHQVSHGEGDAPSILRNALNHQVRQDGRGIPLFYPFYTLKLIFQDLTPHIFILPMETDISRPDPAHKT
jgi:hypothetical protein